MARAGAGRHRSWPRPSNRSARDDTRRRAPWEGLRVVEVRWPDSQPVSRQPMAQNGTRCRPLYEARDARISILARQKPETGCLDADRSGRLDEAACRRGGPYVLRMTLLELELAGRLIWHPGN